MGEEQAYERLKESNATPTNTACTALVGRAVSHAASRKEACFTAPEVPSRARALKRGLCLSTGSQNLWTERLRLFDLRATSNHGR
jgi:hypothetical protein